MFAYVLKHLRCFGFLFGNHAPSHFLIGFFLNELMGKPGLAYSLISAVLVCLVSGILNLLTYLWRQRYSPEQLVRFHLYRLVERTRKSPEPEALRQDLECLLNAPYLNAAQRERLALLWNQLQTQAVSPTHLRFQLEQML